MLLLGQIIPAFSALIAAVVFGFAVFQYSEQQRFRRLQNLAAIWQRFYENVEFVDLFRLCNDIELDQGTDATLANYSSAVKLRFLALLEEVALFAEYFEVDRKPTSELFRWHFYYVYGSVKTQSQFWQNIGGVEEAQSESWKSQRKFADFSRPTDADLPPPGSIKKVGV